MLVNRRSAGGMPAPNRRSVSKAQYHRALNAHQSPRQPANRFQSLAVPSDTTSSLGDDIRTTRSAYHANCLRFPPINPPTPRTPSSARRPVNRGTRKLPKVKTRTNALQLAWYHEDGNINLEALATLGKRQSCPRNKSYYDRLERILSKTWPPPEKSPRSDDEKLIPLRFVNDDQLTPRGRAERDSFLARLLNSEDLTEEELDKIAYYFVSDEMEEEDSTPRSCLKKSPRPKSSVSKKTTGDQDPDQNQGVKAVRFTHSSPLPASDGKTSPHSSRAHSAPVTSSLGARRPSDPFHVASPISSPRPLGSPDEVAYLHDIESPPEVPASPRPVPKITYYDESGEEIEEEIQTKEQACGTDKDADENPPQEPSSSSSAESSPKSEQRPDSAGEETPEHLPEEDTPRLNRDTTDAQGSPQSESHSKDSQSPIPRGQVLSDISESPRRPSSRRSSLTNTESSSLSPSHQHNASPTRDADSSQNSPTKSDPGASPTDEASSSPETAQQHSEYAPQTENSLSPPKKHRSKSGKRKKSHSGERKSSRSDKPEHTETDNSLKPSDSSESPGCRNPPERTTPAEEEPLPIPVISLTHGQLASVPARSPRIQTSDAQPPGQSPSKQNPTESLSVQHSPRSSTLQGFESQSEDIEDNRMKIWLTRKAWNRHVDCSE